jgi:hypothetical protein
LDLSRTIRAYHNEAAGEHHRYRSWEHCYGYFRQARERGLARERDHAALQLAFYLASWGMYRGSSFLLQHTYTVHRGIIDLVAEKQFDAPWSTDLGASAGDTRFVPKVHDLIEGIRTAYRPFVPATGSAQPTDTLITKIILGTFGCLPACDRYFVDGFKSQGFEYSYLNDNLIGRLLRFCQSNLPQLREEQAGIERASGIRYPLMKLVDMYFWQLGYEADMNAPRQRPTERTAQEPRKQSVYEEIIARFMAQGARSAQVSVEGMNTATLRAGLRRELKGINGVRLVQRGAETYLIRLTATKR